MTADGVPVRSIDTLTAGQKVVLHPPPDNVRITGCELEIDVIFEDAHLLVVNKPPYIAVHPGGEQHTAPTMAAAVVAYYAKNGTPLSFRPAGRLDRNTSGILLAGKNSHAAHWLNHNVQKEYIAIVTGRLEGDGIIDQPIRIRDGYGISREVGEGGKPSITRWEAINSGDNLSAVRLKLETGRTHQIRVHMAWLGHPLAGDTMYGPEDSETIRLIGRHALHCSDVRLIHPSTGQELTLSAPLPDDMAALR